MKMSALTRSVPAVLLSGWPSRYIQSLCCERLIPCLGLWCFPGAFKKVKLHRTQMVLLACTWLRWFYFHILLVLLLEVLGHCISLFCEIG